MRNGFEKVFMGAAGSAGGGGLDVDEVFSTQLYSGSSANRNIVNGIDLDGEGGMIWTKARTANFNNVITDTEQGLSPYLVTHATSKPDNGGSDTVTSFNSNGYSLGADGQWYWNKSGYNYASWTWRKAPKFFDVVTYTGSGSAKTVAHSLDSVPGMIIIKNISIAGDSWAVYHRANTAAPQTDYLVLNTTAATVDSAAWWNDTAPTSSVFTVGTDHAVNANNENYVAYVFAHNDSGDGEFGPDSDQDIIKCGGVTATGGAFTVNLGFEPQWVMLKKASGSGDWIILDSMRGVTADGVGSFLVADAASSTQTSDADTFFFDSTGLRMANFSAGDYIYMAIRRGSLFPPEAATEVFAMDTYGSTTPRPPAFKSGFPVDFAFWKNTSDNWQVGSRLTQGKRLFFTSAAEHTSGSEKYDYQTGYINDTYVDSSINGWMWKRAPGYFDVVCYSGNSTAGHNVSHNLGVAPEMMWVKARSGTNAASGSFMVYHSALGAGKAMYLNADNTPQTNAVWWNNTAPTSTVFTLGTSYHVNKTGAEDIAWLFATLAGVSKVGSVTHSGTTNVDCGFSAGARFVLLKRTDATGGWYVWDSVRGIIAGNDPYLLLNTTANQVTNTDFIDPLNAGFTISDNFTDGDYIFYAIA